MDLLLEECDLSVYLVISIAGAGNGFGEGGLFHWTSTSFQHHPTIHQILDRSFFYPTIHFIHSSHIISSSHMIR